MECISISATPSVFLCVLHFSFHFAAGGPGIFVSFSVCVRMYELYDTRFGTFVISLLVIVMTNVFPILRYRENIEERNKTVRRTIACGVYSYYLGGTGNWLGIGRDSKIRSEITGD